MESVLAPRQRPAFANPLRTFALPRPRLDRWSGYAWGAIGLTTAFVLLTYWWLTQDHGIPGTEPGAALYATLVQREMLHSGDLLGPLKDNEIHPPLLQIVGAISMLVGGINPRAPTVGENLVFVPLLTLGCYGTGKLLAGPRAGLLAVAFALGAPLLIEQFHVFMVDAPDAALVATSVWLILASERFTRPSVAAFAGVAVGLGLETKQPFPFFIAGLLAVVLLREGGWRNWRGIAAFAAAALVVGSPWYLIHLSNISELTGASVTSATPGTLPNRLSLDNVTWYGWGALNTLLCAPLFAIAATGIARATMEVVRSRRALDPGDVRPELLAGALVSWLALLATPIHVVRYMLPMMVYLATLGTAWIVALRVSWQRVAMAALALAVVATTLGATFGVGSRVRVMLAGSVPDRSVYGIRLQDQVVLYAPRSFMVTGPDRGGDMLALMHALRRNGMLQVAWMPETEEPYFYDHYGIDTFAAMANLATLGSIVPEALPPRTAMLLRQRQFGSAPPCLRLGDGTGVWVRLRATFSLRVPDYCPFRHPAFYGP